MARISTVRPVALLLLSIFVFACAARQPTQPNAPVSGIVAMRPSAPMAMVPAGPPLDSDQLPVGDAPVLGANNALLTLVEFGDFQCPFCARVQRTLEELRHRYPQELRIVWRNEPLPFHNNARLAAEAALAAGAQGRFWEMHDLLYENNRALERHDLDRYATQLQLDMTRFAHDLDTHAFAPVIERDMDLGTRLNVQGVPHFFLNGTRIVGAQPVEQFVAAIDAALTRARSMPRERVYADMVREALAHAAQFPAADAPVPRPSHGQPDPAAVYRVPVADSPVRGPADALVTVVVFSDFQCPFCGRVEPTLASLADRYGRELRIVWKNNPLPFHDNAMPSAIAALEVYRQQGVNGFWHFHDTLFHNQAQLDRQSLEQFARAQSVDMTAFRNALDNHVHDARIQEDMHLATALDAAGTPTFFINGVRLVGAQPIDRFVTVIDERLAEARQQLAQGITRANLYGHLTDNGATAAVYLPFAPEPSGGDATHRVYAVRPNPNAASRGPANAPVVLEHFSDFECPFCARIDPTIEQVVQRYGSRVRVVWRDYPLPFHPHAMLAAEAGREVLAQRGSAAFWAFHDQVFQNQRALERADLERYAVTAGVDVTRFRRALDRHTHQAEVQADIAAGDATGAEMGTPATFVNGHALIGAMPLADFVNVIDAALQAPAPPPTH